MRKIATITGADTTARRWLAVILLASFALNVWGIGWGLPQRWHPDELTQRAENMVGGPTLNPHYFAYGGFHYYVLAAVSVLPVKIPNKLFDLVDYATQSSVIVVLSRLVSALMATGIVYLTYRIGSALFTRTSGLLAAAFTACSMVLVNAAHFATADVPSLFWFTLACAAATVALRTGATSAYVVAGTAAGLAAAVKYVGGLALVALAVAHLLRGERRHRPLGLAVLLAGGAFVLGNPTLLFAPVELIDGFVMESLFNSLRGAGLPRAYLPLLAQLREAVGIPLFLLAWAGIIYALWLLWSGRQRAEVLLLLAMLLPYYLVVGAMRGPRAGPLLLPIAPVRYTLPLVPFLLILAAAACTDFSRARFVPVRGVALAVIAVALGYSAAYAVAADLQFTNDSRYAARAWIIERMPPGTYIETTSYGPDLPGDRYVIVERPHDNHVGDVAHALAASPAYARYQRVTAPVRRWLHRVGIDAAPRYVPWSERADQRYAADSAGFDTTLAGLTARAPRLFVASDLYTTRFGETPSREGAFFAALRAGGGGYREVARFHYALPTWLDPAPEFVNPVITVYAQVPS